MQILQFSMNQGKAQTLTSLTRPAQANVKQQNLSQAVRVLFVTVFV